jgi:hypothetical protein
VQLAHGVFTEAGIYLNRDIVLRRDTDALGLIVIDGQDADRILYCRAFSTIEGLTFRNGLAATWGLAWASGGGIYCDYGGGHIASCILDNNKAVSTGGGVCLWGHQLPSTTAPVSRTGLRMVVESRPVVALRT